MYIAARARPRSPTPGGNAVRRRPYHVTVGGLGDRPVGSHPGHLTRLLATIRKLLVALDNTAPLLRGGFQLLVAREAFLAVFLTAFFAEPETFRAASAAVHSLVV